MCWPGRGAKDAAPLVFSARIDTVPVGRQPWSVPSFAGEVRDGRLYGRGASDMKSGLVAMAEAALLLADAGTTLAGNLLLAISAGDSTNCLGARRFVARGGVPNAGALSVREPTSLDRVTAAMAVLWLDVVAHGQIGHVSGDAGLNDRRDGLDPGTSARCRTALC